MKKRVLGILLTGVLTLSLLAGCGKEEVQESPVQGAKETTAEETDITETNTGDAEPALTGKPLRVGTMAKAMGLPLKYAQDKGYFADRGLEIEIVTFATGAPINEAMNAGELDVAVSGMASVYSLATGNYTYIGDTMISEKGQSLYVRPNSPIAACESVNDIIGSAETVKGMSILGPLSTSAQYNAIKYVESFGLTANDFTMVSMEYAQAYQAFITGEGDGIASTPPYAFQLEDAGMVKVADVSTLMGQPLTDGIFVPNEIVEERRADLQVLLEVYYQACQELLDDEALRAEVGMNWYAEEGVTYSEEDMANEIMAQTYTTLDNLKSEDYEFGATMTNMGQFFSTQGLIETENLSNIENSFDTSFVEKIIGNSVKTSHIEQ